MAPKAVALRTRVASSALSTYRCAATANAATAAPKQTQEKAPNHVLRLPSLRPIKPRTKPGATNFDVAFLQNGVRRAAEGAYSRGAGRRPDVTKARTALLFVMVRPYSHNNKTPQKIMKDEHGMPSRASKASSGNRICGSVLQ